MAHQPPIDLSSLYTGQPVATTASATLVLARDVPVFAQEPPHQLSEGGAPHAGTAAALSPIVPAQAPAATEWLLLAVLACVVVALCVVLATRRIAARVPRLWPT